MEHVFDRIDPARWSLTGILGALWGYLVPLYVHIAAVVPLYWLALLWVLDMICGIWQALRVGGWRSLSLRQAEHGTTKLVKYSCVLGVTCVLRDSHMLGVGIVCGIIEAHILLKVFGSILRNIGKIFADPGIERAGEFAEGRADGSFLGRKDK